MLRIGVHFEGLAAEAAARIDRFLARRIHATVRGRATLRELLFGDRESERRRARRVAVIDDDDLSVRMESGEHGGDRFPLAIQASLVAIDGAPCTRALRICSISPSGCAYLEQEAEAPTPGALLELELSGAELALRVTGRVVYALKTVTPQG